MSRDGGTRFREHFLGKFMSLRIERKLPASWEGVTESMCREGNWGHMVWVGKELRELTAWLCEFR